MSKPFIKWAGGKEKELKIIIPNLPRNINNFIEPFVGGGAVYFSFDAVQISGSKYINDFSEELVSVYTMIAKNNELFFSILRDINTNWNLLSQICRNHQTTLLGFYHNYKENSNLQVLKDSITEFMLRHNEDFNGMHEMEFNRRIDEFDYQIRKTLERKIKRVCKLERESKNFGDENVLDNIETAFKSAFYTHIRSLYNDRNDEELLEYFTPERKTAFFYFIREFCYTSMFRYNAKGEFNVPYGGMAYNKKSFISKIEYISSNEIVKYLSTTKIFNLDFEIFLNNIVIQPNDFLFLDPPYDSEFSDYAQKTFTKEDHIRLANILAKIKARIMIVIKYTPYIYQLYSDRGFTIEAFDKTYMANFQNRNDRKVSHLLIKNY